MTKVQQQAAERKEAADTLLNFGLGRGTRVYSMVVHRAKSGMTRWVRLFVATVDLKGKVAPNGDRSPEARIEEITGLVARATGMRWDDKGIRVGGCGFDAGHHIVYHLSHEMFEGDRAGYALVHERL